VIWPQNHSDGFLQFGLKTGGDGFFQFGLKLVARVSWFGPQNRQLRFGDLGLKITMTVFLVWAPKPSGLRFVSHATKLTEGGRHGTRVNICASCIT
jgi:hypothetical protein